MILLSDYNSISNQKRQLAERIKHNIRQSYAKIPQENIPNDIDSSDKPISKVYAEIDNDLARDNLENDITAADLQDL